MCALKKLVPLMLVGVAVCNWSHFAYAGQNIDLAKVQDNRKKLIETSSCPGCELAGVNLSGVNLDRVNLTGANLKGAHLSQARLHLATLNKANLQNADLRDVEFGGADLAEADLRGANLRGATFVGAYLVGIQLDKGVALNQPSEESVVENIPTQDAVEKSLPAQEGLGVTSVVDKKEDKDRVATSPQPLDEVTGKKASPPPAEPGFFDQTLRSVKGLFGQGESDEKKTVVEKSSATGKPAKITPEAAPSVQAAPKQDVVSTTPPVKEQPPIEAKGKQVVPPSTEPGFFDKTLGSVKGLFGQGESDEKKTVVEKSVATRETAKVTSETPVVQAVPKQDVVADIPPVKDQPVVEVKGTQVASPSTEPGFFDKTLGSVKGLFGQGENDEKKLAAEKSAASGKTAEVTPETAPVVQAASKHDVVADIPQPPVEVKGTQVASPSTEPGFFDKTLGSVKGLFGQGESESKAVTGKHDDDIQKGKQLQGNEMTAAQASENKTDPAAETAKNKALLLETKHCYGCNLAGVDLTGKNMDSADLEGADLSGSRLEGVDFENANLKGTILIKANLRNADLRKADLYKANLSGADLTGAKLDGALLDDAQLSDVVGYELQGRQ
jgi:uncharacterized protein YjbI with pentapeptide repeats